jgi:hypothetical protein
MLFATLLKQKNLSNNQLYNNFKKNLCNKVYNMHKKDFENEYINMYVNKKQLRISTSTYCKYCKGTGWIIWRASNNVFDSKTNKSLEPIFSYSLCFKCNKF